MIHPIGGRTAAQVLRSLAADAPPPLIQAEEYAVRLERARALLHTSGAKALVIGAGDSMRYFCGLGWGASERLVALVIGRRGQPVIIAPRFELGSLLAGLAFAADPRVWEEDEDPFVLLAGAIREHGSTVLLDPCMPVAALFRLARTDAGLDLRDGSPVIDGCRSTKSATEIDLLARAMAITLRVQREAASVLAPGMLAREAVSFIDAAHRALGADDGSFFCAVQFGSATAFPHGVPGDQSLREGDLVLVDTGCRLRGYHSDISRTYGFGGLSGEPRRVWEVERDAQLAAFTAARPGVACAAVDQAARRVLERHGFGPGYGLPGLPHRTGHGIGLSIHEPPWLVPGDATPLARGMCCSNEPMIVVPDRFGIRLEDHFHLTGSGAAWFTQPATDPDAPLD